MLREIHAKAETLFGILEVTDVWDTNYVSQNVFELCYIFKGSCTRLINGNTTATLSSSMFCLSDPECKIEYIPDRSTDFSLIRILFPPEFLDYTLKNCTSIPDLTLSPLLRFRHILSPFFNAETIFSDADGSIGMLFQRALNEHQNHTHGYREFIRCFILEIILHMLRQQISFEYTPIYDKYLRLIHLYCTEHYAEDITLKGLAEKMHFSLPYLSNKFKQLTGYTFKNYLQSVRVEEACRLLSFTKKSVIEVAESVGYNDTRSFVKVFKAHMQMTPTQYRKQNENPLL